MIYKYCNIETATQTVKNNFLKFTPPNEFNDPYDIHVDIKPYSVNDFPKLFNTLKKKKDLFEQFKNAGIYNNWTEFVDKLSDNTFRSIVLKKDSEQILNWVNTFPDTLSKDLLITCFSEDPSSILMWAHYAEKFMGCVLGFDYDQDEYLSRYLAKVKYKNKPFSIDVKYCYGYRNNKLLANSAKTKYKDWSYEKEQRIIMHKKMLQSLKTTDNEIFGLTNCNQHIKQIILGNRCNNSVLINLLSRLSDQYKIPFNYGRLKAHEYKVVIMESV